MYTKKRGNRPQPTSIRYNESYEGEPIEQTIARMRTTNEPLTATTPIIYTERREGVKPEGNIRTDKMELALDVADTMSKSKLAKRKGRLEREDNEAKERLRAEAERQEQRKNMTGGQSTEATNQ